MRGCPEDEDSAQRTKRSMIRAIKGGKTRGNKRAKKTTGRGTGPEEGGVRENDHEELKEEGPEEEEEDENELGLVLGRDHDEEGDHLLAYHHASDGNGRSRLTDGSASIISANCIFTSVELEQLSRASIMSPDCNRWLGVTRSIGTENQQSSPNLNESPPNQLQHQQHHHHQHHHSLHNQPSLQYQADQLHQHQIHHQQHQTINSNVNLHTNHTSNQLMTNQDHPTSHSSLSSFGGVAGSGYPTNDVLLLDHHNHLLQHQANHQNESQSSTTMMIAQSFPLSHSHHSSNHHQQQELDQNEMHMSQLNGDAHLIMQPPEHHHHHQSFNPTLNSTPSSIVSYNLSGFGSHGHSSINNNQNEAHDLNHTNHLHNDNNNESTPQSLIRLTQIGSQNGHEPLHSAPNSAANDEMITHNVPLGSHYNHIPHYHLASGGRTTISHSNNQDALLTSNALRYSTSSSPSSSSCSNSTSNSTSTSNANANANTNANNNNSNNGTQNFTVGSINRSISNHTNINYTNNNSSNTNSNNLTQSMGALLQEDPRQSFSGGPAPLNANAQHGSTCWQAPARNAPPTTSPGGTSLFQSSPTQSTSHQLVYLQSTTAAAASNLPEPHSMGGSVFVSPSSTTSNSSNTTNNSTSTTATKGTATGKGSPPTSSFLLGLGGGGASRCQSPLPSYQTRGVQSLLTSGSDLIASINQHFPNNNNNNNSNSTTQNIATNQHQRQQVAPKNSTSGATPFNSNNTSDQCGSSTNRLHSNGSGAINHQLQLNQAQNSNSNFKMDPDEQLVGGERMAPKSTRNTTTTGSTNNKNRISTHNNSNNEASDRDLEQQQRPSVANSNTNNNYNNCPSTQQSAVANCGGVGKRDRNDWLLHNDNDPCALPLAGLQSPEMMLKRVRRKSATNLDGQHSWALALNWIKPKLNINWLINRQIIPSEWNYDWLWTIIITPRGE